MADDVGRLLAPLARAFQEQLETLTATMAARIVQEMPTLAIDRSPLDFLGASIRANSSTLYHAIEFGIDPTTMPVPEDVLAYVRKLARRAVPVEERLRAFRIGQAAAGPIIHATIARICSDPAEENLLALRFADLTFRYLDRVAVASASTYEAEKTRMAHSRPHRDLQAVNRLLAAQGQLNENPITPYPLEARHLGAVLWYELGTDVDSPARALDQTATDMARALRCADEPLLTAPDDQTLWAWFPDPKADATAELMASLAGSGARYAFGEPSCGPGGFHFTHRRALQAQTIATLNPESDRTTTFAAEIGPLGLMAGSPEDLRLWARLVLGGLGSDSESTARLRETLSAYLGSGSSLSAAAAQLGLHKNTVLYRLNRAEVVRGPDPHGTRVDLEFALLACELLGPLILDPPLTP